MNSEILAKLDEIINTIDNCASINKLNILKSKIFEDKELLNKIALLKDDRIQYGKEYVNLKREVLKNEYFKEYKDIENELYFLTKEINNKLNSLIKGDL